MKVFSFICRSATAALAQIHAELGPDAIVLSVRPLPRNGLARLWRKDQRVEVLACVSDTDDEACPSNAAPEQPGFGIAPSQLLAHDGSVRPLHDGSGRPHVFVGPPGTGKTTLLCKWMTRSVLQDQRGAAVWRLDGTTANTAEFLNVYCEMLGLTVQRYWDSAGLVTTTPGPERAFESTYPATDLLLVDLPGVAAHDSRGLRELGTQLSMLSNPRLHLVLNAAYDPQILWEQYRAFAELELEDVSLCHLDEARDVEKLTAFLKGINCSLRFIGTGQKIPGDLVLKDEAPADCALVAG